MNKIVMTLIVIICVLTFASCEGGNELPTYLSDETEAETVALKLPSVEEMSPEEFTEELPMELPFEIPIEKIRSCKEITAEQSYMEDSKATNIYMDGFNQYFVFSDSMALAIYTDGDSEKDRTYFYSAYYNEDGHLFFFGDDIYSWYYNDSGEIYLKTYSYIFYGDEVGVTFYGEDNKRIGSYSGGIYYDKDMNEMSIGEQIEFLQQLGEAAEIYMK